MREIKNWQDQKQDKRFCNTKGLIREMLC